MKLNLGSGFNYLTDHVNVDIEPNCKPDVVHDLELTPWPFSDSTFDSIRACHVLEHLGQTPRSFLNIMKEIWRISKPNAVIEVMVPHWRHDNFFHDPTHVRAITPITLAMFDQERNIKDHLNKGQESKLGLLTGTDFEVVQVNALPDSQFQNMKPEQLQFLAASMNNVAQEITILMKVHKPARRSADELFSKQTRSTITE